MHQINGLNIFGVKGMNPGKGNMVVARPLIFGSFLENLLNQKLNPGNGLTHSGAANRNHVTTQSGRSAVMPGRGSAVANLAESQLPWLKTEPQKKMEAGSSEAESAGLDPVVFEKLKQFANRLAVYIDSRQFDDQGKKQTIPSPNILNALFNLDEIRQQKTRQPAGQNDPVHEIGKGIYFSLQAGNEPALVSFQFESARELVEFEQYLPFVSKSLNPLLRGMSGALQINMYTGKGENRLPLSSYTFDSHGKAASDTKGEAITSLQKEATHESAIPDLKAGRSAAQPAAGMVPDRGSKDTAAGAAKDLSPQEYQNLKVFADTLASFLDTQKAAGAGLAGNIPRPKMLDMLFTIDEALRDQFRQGMTPDKAGREISDGIRMRITKNNQLGQMVNLQFDEAGDKVKFERYKPFIEGLLKRYAGKENPVRLRLTVSRGGEQDTGNMNAKQAADPGADSRLKIFPSAAQKVSSKIRPESEIHKGQTVSRSGISQPGGKKVLTQNADPSPVDTSDPKSRPGKILTGAVRGLPDNQAPLSQVSREAVKSASNFPETLASKENTTNSGLTGNPIKVKATSGTAGKGSQNVTADSIKKASQDGQQTGGSEPAQDGKRISKTDQDTGRTKEGIELKTNSAAKKPGSHPVTVSNRTTAARVGMERSGAEPAAVKAFDGSAADRPGAAHNPAPSQSEASRMNTEQGKMAEVASSRSVDTGPGGPVKSTQEHIKSPTAGQPQPVDPSGNQKVKNGQSVQPSDARQKVEGSDEGQARNNSAEAAKQPGAATGGNQPGSDSESTASHQGRQNFMAGHSGAVTARLKETGHFKRTESARPQLIHSVQELIEQALKPGSPRRVNAQLQLQNSPVGKLEIQYQQESHQKSITVVVESESARHELQKILPIIQDNLQQKGIELQALKIDIGTFSEKQENPGHSSGHTGNQSSHQRKEAGDEPEESTLAKRKFGYNTLEVIA